VAALLADTGEFRSAQELHAALRAAGDKVGLATVYRNLQAMAAEGEVDMLRTDEGEAVYRACSTGHHHHLVCRTCGRTVEVEGPAVEAWANRVSAQHGFTEVHHTLEIFGTCADCAAAARP
jgi:Fur family ferric uptake transcriptional regulator